MGIVVWYPDQFSGLRYQLCSSSFPALGMEGPLWQDGGSLVPYFDVHRHWLRALRGKHVHPASRTVFRPARLQDGQNYESSEMSSESSCAAENAVFVYFCQVHH